MCKYNFSYHFEIKPSSEFLVVVGPSGPQRTGLHKLLDKEDSPFMDEKGSKKILELSETPKEAKIVGSTPRLEGSQCLDMDPINCIGPNSGGQSKVNFQ